MRSCQMPALIGMRFISALSHTAEESSGCIYYDAAIFRLGSRFVTPLNQSAGGFVLGQGMLKQELPIPIASYALMNRGVSRKLSLCVLYMLLGEKRIFYLFRVRSSINLRVWLLTITLSQSLWQTG